MEDRANKTLELKMSAENSKVAMLEQKLETENLAHQSALDELDHAQKAISAEMQKVAQLQAEKRQMMTLREEIQLEKESKRDLANENTLIKEQLDRMLKADQTGSQIWRDRESQLGCSNKTLLILSISATFFDGFSWMLIDQILFLDRNLYA